MRSLRKWLRDPSVALALVLGLLGLAVACQGQLSNLQSDLQKIYGRNFGVVNADMQAILASIPQDVAAGKITAAQGQQLAQCPTQILAFGALIQQIIGGTIPPGAAAGWILYKLKVASSSDVATVSTQAKLIVGNCQALLNIPGLPF